MYCSWQANSKNYIKCKGKGRVLMPKHVKIINVFEGFYELYMLWVIIMYCNVHVAHFRDQCLSFCPSNTPSCASISELTLNFGAC